MHNVTLTALTIVDKMLHASEVYKGVLLTIISECVMMVVLMLDQELTLLNHANNVCRTSYWHLRQMTQIR